jgi:ABC-type amino acid transport substrate-binding protein
MRTHGFRKPVGALIAAAAFAAGLYPRTLHSDLPQFKERGRLRVLVAEGSPELFSWKRDAPPGFEREILEGFARLHRLDLAIVPARNWNSLVPALLADQGDLIAGGFTPTRSLAGQLEFSTEVFPTRYVVVTRAPHRLVISQEELREERVGTVKGSGMQEAIEEAGVPAANVDDGIAPGGVPAALRAGRVTAGVIGVEHALLAQRSDHALQLGLVLPEQRSLAFAMRREDVRLRDSLNEYLSNFRRTTSWNRLVLAYFGDASADILRTARSR